MKMKRFIFDFDDYKYLNRSNLNSVVRYRKYVGKIVVKRAMLKKGAQKQLSTVRGHKNRRDKLPKFICTYICSLLYFKQRVILQNRRLRKHFECALLK